MKLTVVIPGFFSGHLKIKVVKSGEVHENGPEGPYGCRRPQFLSCF